MDDSPLLNTMTTKEPITSNLTVTVNSHAKASLSSSSSNSSELSTSSASSTSNQLNDDPSVVRIINNQQQLSNMHQTNVYGGCFVSNKSKQLIESLLIKKSHEHQQKGCISSSTSSNSLSNLIKSNSFGYAGENNDIECAAKKYRCSAQNSEATCSWKGILPAKTYKSPVVYSTKVFVGGLPWDITEEDIIKEFGVFGPCRVEWTHKEKFNSNVNKTQHQFHKYPFNNQNTVENPVKQRSSPAFVYVIYENEFSVRGLVNNCIEDYANGRDRVEFFFKISTRRVRNKEVQIIPWILADNNYALCTPKDLDPKKTVFVGNLHGRIGARDLAHIMNELFGGVVYAGIDIDKLKYPIGSGRVTFASQQNFMLAIRASFVDIKTSKFSKRVQIDPYLEDVECCMCNEDKGIYFCRDFKCFNYYCAMCWSGQHAFDISREHKPLMRRRENKL